MPPGLGEPSTALMSLTSFLWLKPELVEVAAQRSAPACQPYESKVTAAAWLATLSAEEKNAWLMRFLSDTEGQSSLALHRDFQLAIHRDLRASREADPAFNSLLPPRRSAGELLKAAEALADLRLRSKKQREDEARVEREQEAAKARLVYLRSLAGQETNVWKSTIALTATTTPANYDAAVRQLLDLRDLSLLTGDRVGFSKRLAELRNLRGRKRSLIARLDKANLK